MRLIRAPLLAAVLIPCLQNPGEMFLNIRPDNVQLPRREFVTARQGDWLEPELAHHALTADVHVLRLTAVEAIEIEPVRTRDVPDSRHSSITRRRKRRENDDSLIRPLLRRDVTA